LERKEFRYKCKDGNFKWISWNVKFDWDEGSVYGAGRDISNSRDLENTVYDSNEKLKAIIENMSEGVFNFDKDGKYTTINKSARDMFPSTVQTIRKIGDSRLENKCYDIYGKLLTYEDTPALRILRGEKVSGFRFSMKANNNNIYYYDINGIPLYDDKRNFIAGIQCWSNVTETVLYEKILQSQG